MTRTSRNRRLARRMGKPKGTGHNNATEKTMQPISDLTTRLREKSREPSQNETRSVNPLAQAFRQTTASNYDRPTITQSHIDRLWQHMSATFGHKWISSYGAMPSETWLAGLVDMTPEELRTGLVTSLTWEQEWPPTLPQFRNLCRPRREEAHQVYQALPEPDSVREQRKAVGMAHLTSLREEGRYREWLQANSGRVISDFDSHLRTVSAWVK